MPSHIAPKRIKIRNKGIITVDPQILRWRIANKARLAKISHNALGSSQIKKETDTSTGVAKEGSNDVIINPWGLFE